jgi:two-component sensor histidine kinase
MQIEPALRAILTAAMVVQATLSLSMLFAHVVYGRRIPYIKYWASASGMVSIGYGLYALVDRIPFFFTAVVANCFFVAGMCFILQGSLTLIGRAASRWVYPAALAAGGIVFFFFGYVFPSFAVRNLLVSLVVSASSAASAYLLFRGGSPALKKTTAIGAWTYVAYALFYLVRALHLADALWLRGMDATLLPAQELRLMYFTMAFFIVLGASFSTMMAGLLISDLETSVAENKTLLSEIRHRTKNNLALIGSLISLQEHDQKDPGTRRAMAELKKRLNTITVVYRLLGRYENVRQADVRGYLEALCAGIRDSIAQGSPSAIAFDVASESLLLDADTLVPLGLIVNELATNSMKYAFPDGRPGTVSIRFATKDGACVLEVADDGVGFDVPPDERLRRHETGSLGLFLVRSLAGQLRGKLSAESAPGKGARFTLVFKA